MNDGAGIPIDLAGILTSGYWTFGLSPIKGQKTLYEWFVFWWRWCPHQCILELTAFC